MKLTNRTPFSYWVFVASMLALALRAAEEPKPAEPPKPARQQLKAERLASDNTFLYIATPDLKKARGAFERTAFHALLQEEEVAQPVVTAFGKLRDAFVKGDGTRSEADMRCRSNEVELLLRLAPLLENQAALAVEGDISNFMASGMLPRFLLVASMPSGDEGEAWQRQLEEAMKKHQTSQCIDPHFRDSEEKVANANYYVSRIENAELGITEAWAFVENLFLYGQGKRIVEDAIERFAVKSGAGTLADHAGYQAAYKQAGREGVGEALVYLQANIRPLLEHFLASFPAFRKVLDPRIAALEANRPHFAMGVHSTEGANAAIKEKILLRLNKEALPKAGGSCEGVTARFAQNNALFWSATQGNLTDLYSDLAACWKPGKAEAAPDAEKGDPLQLRSAMGAQNDAELSSKLGLFKGEFAVLMNYTPQPNLKMDNWLDYLEVFQPVFVVELDPLADSSVHDLLSRIQQSTGHQYVSVPVATAAASVQISYQFGAVPPEVAPGTLGLFRNLANPSETKPPFFTAGARVDLDLEGGKQRKFVLLSESVEALTTAIRVAQPKFSHTSLVEDKQLKELTRTFRESRNSVSYLDLKRLTTMYADVLPKLTRSGAIRRQLVEQLPGANVLRDHLFPMACATSVITDPDGLLVEFSSPMGNLPMVGVLGAVAWPVIVEKQQEGVSDEVDDKFRRLKLALHLYASSFNRFPSQLSDLHPNYVKAKGDQKLKLFESPFKRGGVSAPQDIDNPELTNLVYIPNRSLQDLGGSILAYEKEPTKLVRLRDGPRLFYHVLTLDDKKAWMTKAQLERTLSGKAELLGTGVTEPAKDTKK